MRVTYSLTLTLSQRKREEASFHRGRENDQLSALMGEEKAIFPQERSPFLYPLPRQERGCDSWNRPRRSLYTSICRPRTSLSSNSSSAHGDSDYI